MSRSCYPSIRPQVMRIVGHFCEIEKPGKMVGNNKNAGREKCYRGEGNQWPSIGEVLKVNKVADDGEYCRQ